MTTCAPVVTVIIATYNWSSVLPFSIGSVLLQSFGDFEVLVIGDGCTDDSADVVRAVGDPRVRWINMAANSGHQSGPNNEGLRQARGKFIAYLGHDDLWLPHHLMTMVAALEDGADLVHGITRMVVPHGGALQWLQPAYRPGDWIPPSNAVHRRSMVEQVGGWRDYRELTVDPEIDLWSRFHEAGGHVVFVPRLGTIKFPAAVRRDVYREKPCHEQSAWFERIQHDPNIEALELAGLLAKTLAPVPEPTYRAQVKSVLGRTLWEIRQRLTRAHAQPAAVQPGAVIEARRRFKGFGQSSTSASNAGFVSGGSSDD